MLKCDAVLAVAKMLLGNAPACAVTLIGHVKQLDLAGTHPEHPRLNVVQDHHPHSVVLEVAVGGDVEPVACTG